MVGELNPHYSKLIRVLQDGESVELQALFVPSLSRHAIPVQPRVRGQKAEKAQAKFATLSLILYGSMEMFESIGDFLSQCSEYLQPPLRCDRNVPYHNPQSLTGSEKETQMTFELQGDLSSSQVEAMALIVNPSDALATEDLNPETEAPAAVKSSLYRYVAYLNTTFSNLIHTVNFSDLIGSSHQKRALNFMLMRERSVRPFDRTKEQWKPFFDEAYGITK